MTTIKAGEVERVLKRKPLGAQLLLLYGPDAGRVSERARAAAEGAVADPADPFQLVAMDGDDVADRPGRLVEEATTYGLFGESRAIWVRPTSRAITAAVAACLETSLAGVLVVIEAGELAKSSPLRQVCEASPLAYALPCYVDETRDVGAVVDETLQAEGLRIDPEARTLLIESLGGDRLATRAELDKLALYCRGTGAVTRSDVEAAVSDVSTLSIDLVLDAAFAGRVGELSDGWAQHVVHGTAPAAILAGTLRHALSLMSSRSVMDRDGNVDTALAAWRGLPFRRRPAIRQQLTQWRVSALQEVVAALQASMLASRQSAVLTAPIAAASLLRIGAYAEARSGRPRSERQSPSS